MHASWLSLLGLQGNALESEAQGGGDIEPDEAVENLDPIQPGEEDNIFDLSNEFLNQSENGQPCEAMEEEADDFLDEDMFWEELAQAGENDPPLWPGEPPVPPESSQQDDLTPNDRNQRALQFFK